MKNMKLVVFGALTLLLFVTGGVPSDARLLDRWSFDRLVAESDLVAVIESIENRPAKDVFPGYSYGHSTADFVATDTRFRVATVFKAKGKSLTELTVLHFGYSANVMIVNGAHFVRFGIGPLQYEKRDMRDGKPVGGTVAFQQQPVWLAFLKQREDGRFEPVTGHYDSAMSFRELHEPSFYFGSKP